MSNTLTNVIPKILEQGLAVLRANAVMPKLVNRDYDSAAAKKGAVINIPKHNEFAVRNVAPGFTPDVNNVNDIAPTNVAVTLDQWIESPFIMTDKELKEVQDGTVPNSVESAVASICNRVDIDMMGLYKKVGNSVGAAGTTPFATIADATNARKYLVDNKMPMDGRAAMVLDASAEAKALQLSTFHQAEQRGDTSGLTEGYIGRKFGMDWHVDQNVVSHTSTPLSAGAATVNGINAAGATSISIAKLTNPSDLVEGDLLTFENDTQSYVVTADTTLAVGNTSVPIYPALKQATAGAESVTLTASSVSNLSFHRSAFVLASRPLADIIMPGSLVQSVTDDITGLTLRLEVTRQHKQTQWSFDVLYGLSELYPEHAVRVLG